MASASTLYSNDFSANSNGFSGAAIANYGAYGNFYGILAGGTTATLSLAGLGANLAVNLVFNLYTLNSMDGDNGSWGPDAFAVKINGVTALNNTFSNYPNDPSFNQNYGGPGSVAGTGSVSSTPSVGWNGATEFTYKIALNGTTDANGNLTVDFIGNSNQGWGDEGFGIDNVSVSTVPVPAGLPLLAGGLALLGLARRRKA